MEKIRVLIVDDSSLAREALKNILGKSPDIEVVGEARDGEEAIEKTKCLKPSVVTMDITMPRMDGLQAMEIIMEENPVPIVIVSSLDPKVITRALTMGAIDFVAITRDIREIEDELIEKIKIASRVRVIRRMKIREITRKPDMRKGNTEVVVAIGVSTGGPQALQVIFSKMPANFPGTILVVQHIASGFIDGLVEWLGLSSPLHMQVAKEGDSLKTGSVYFAPDNFHLVVGEGHRLHLKENITAKLIHVPSIDVLMRSVAEQYGSEAMGVIMTGMGSDGVEGIHAIQLAGGRTVAQNKETSAIFGMNMLAIEKGFVHRVCSLETIADQIVEFSHR